MAILVLAVATVVLLCAWPKKQPKRNTTTRTGRCPTCGSQCRWYFDAETGQKLGFRCDWCQDFNY